MNNRTIYSILGIIILLSISTVILLAYNKNSLLLSPDNSIEINGQKLIFDGLTDLQIEYSISYVKDLDKKYLFLNKNIVFTNNTREYYDTICSTKDCFKSLDYYCGDGIGCKGFNAGGTIYINSLYDKRTVRGSLCHELLHYFVKVGSNDVNDPYHQIIFDLELKGVCYKDG